MPPVAAHTAWQEPKQSKLLLHFMAELFLVGWGGGGVGFHVAWFMTLGSSVRLGVKGFGFCSARAARGWR